MKYHTLDLDMNIVSMVRNNPLFAQEGTNPHPKNCSITAESGLKA